MIGARPLPDASRPAIAGFLLRDYRALQDRYADSHNASARRSSIPPKLSPRSSHHLGQLL